MWRILDFDDYKPDRLRARVQGRDVLSITVGIARHDNHGVGLHS